MDEWINDLNGRFGAGGNIKFDLGEGDLVRATVSSGQSAGEIYLYGAHVTQYWVGREAPLLFVTDKSFFEEGKPIRGGVPVIFPWFGPKGGMDRTQMHGFVRTKIWDVNEVGTGAEGTWIRLGVKSDEGTKKIWPHEFEAALTFSVGAAMKIALSVRNSGAQAFTFEEGLHTYFAILDIERVKVEGLKGHWYRDRTVSEEMQLDTEAFITFPKRVDRLYRDARGTVVIHDPDLKRQIVVAKEHSATTVVWNPLRLGPAEFADLNDADPKRFVCVESCNARDNAYTLQAGQTHTMTAIVAARPWVATA